MQEIFNTEGVRKNNGHIFGLPYNYGESTLVLVPVPWDLTSPGTGGTSKGPSGILGASRQIGLHCEGIGDHWRQGIHMLEISREISRINRELRPHSLEYLQLLEEPGFKDLGKTVREGLDRINSACEEMRSWVFQESARHLHHGKKVSVIGGDHSCTLGLIQVLGTLHEDFGILQIDAHPGLHISFEGFRYASSTVMHHALEIPSMSRLVQVGVRDTSPGERDRMRSDDRIDGFGIDEIRGDIHGGEPWDKVCDRIIGSLPRKVFISFDVDGLDPANCPHTSRPVPGGLDYREASHLVGKLVQHNKEIIGFGLTEVNGEHAWDSSVGARLLFMLCNAMLATRA